RTPDASRLEVPARHLRREARAPDQQLLLGSPGRQHVRQRRTARRLVDRRQAAVRRAARDQRGQARAQAPGRVAATTVDHRTMPRALRVVVGVTGGIAAYKTVSLIREPVLAGHDTEVIATESALRFVG